MRVPPQTRREEPVQTAVCPERGPGAFRTDKPTQEFLEGSYASPSPRLNSSERKQPVTAMTAFALARNFYLAMAFLFLAGFGMLLFFATSNTTLQTIVPDEMRGRVMGVWSLVFGAMIPVGSLEAGAVAHFWGTTFALGFGAIICLVAAIITRVVIARREAAAAT